MTTTRKQRSKYAAKQATGAARFAVPMNARQERYLDALRSNQQVICFGPAGTSKTWTAASYAAELYANKDIDKIVITRPHVPVDNKGLGFLPGDIKDKVLPWALPVIEVLYRHLGKGVVDSGLRDTEDRRSSIEIAPMALIRGRTFDNCFVIADESQNLTFPEIKALVTRMGENSKLVLNGDLRQSDLKEESGLSTLVTLIKKYGMKVPIVEFELEDVVRSDVCKQWIEVFTNEGL